MAVSVDTVYQTVLSTLNKEQRGYVTPQEFNLFAEQAQLDIFEQYFYDINQFGRLHGNSTEYSDMLNILEEKVFFCINSLFLLSFFWLQEARRNRINNVLIIMWYENILCDEWP